MKLKDILGRAAPEERKKIFALWAQCATAEEMKQTSLSSGVPVSDEEAAFLLELKTRGMKRTRELQDDEPDNVAGGCGKKEEPPAYPKGPGGDYYAKQEENMQDWADYLLDNEFYWTFLNYY